MVRLLGRSGTWTPDGLVATALALGGSSVGGPLSTAESQLAGQVGDVCVPRSEIATLRRAIRNGEDPLGLALLSLRDPRERRSAGQFFTDSRTVDAMVAWVASQKPGRVVDGGCGSGRFAVRAAQALPHADIIAVDTDPLATLVTRASLAAALAPSSTPRLRVLNADFLSLTLERKTSATAFIGNPPYVRHHKLSPETKQRGRILAESVGHPISGLAGLHAYFIMQIANLAKAGDIGCLITSSEWLDVGYGSALRDLFVNKLSLRFPPPQSN